MLSSRDTKYPNSSSETETKRADKHQQGSQIDVESRKYSEPPRNLSTGKTDIINNSRFMTRNGWSQHQHCYNNYSNIEAENAMNHQEL